MFAYTSILYNQLLAGLTRFTSRKNWRILLSFFIFIYILVVAFPSFDLLNKDFAGGWNILFQRAAHPLTPSQFAPESHEAKLVFRLFVPVLVRLLHLHIWSVLIFQFLAGIASWFIFIKIVEKFTADKITAALFIMSLACINFSKSTLDIRGVFFDNIAFLFLLIPFLYSRTAVIFICITLAAWTDERALIASAFILLFLLFNFREKNTALKITSVALAWAGYFAGRYYLSHTYHLVTPSAGTGLSVMMAQMNNWLLGIFSGLEGFWALPVLFLFYTIRSKEFGKAVLFAGIILLIIVISLSVADISRSMSYLFISIPLILAYLAAKENTNDLRKIAVIVLVLSFLFPVYSFSSVHETYWSYPLPLQLFRIFFTS